MAGMTLHDLTARASSGDPLGKEEILAACDQLLDEKSSVDERADFLATLHRRGETPEEIAHFVEILLERAVPFPLEDTDCLDVCGTGGDRAGFFNISTTVMFVAAGAGVRVVKHGNRGITSKSGGADVLEALGIAINLPPAKSAEALEAAGCCFLFAPSYHPAFKAVVPVRQLLAKHGSASVFNIIGPLLNPARPLRQLAGVFDEALLATYARAFRLLGRQRAWAVHGLGPDGLRLDEISPFGTTKVHAFDNGLLNTFSIDPAELSIKAFHPGDLLGSDPTSNARITRGILEGAMGGAVRTTVQLNAAAALVVAGVSRSLAEGWQRAGASIDDGHALKALETLRSFS